MNHEPPSFGGQMPPQVPLLGQAKAAARVGILQAVQELSLAIYSRLASTYLGTIGWEEDAADRQLLRRLARHAKKAAEAYFEGLGIAEFTPPEPQKPET